MHLRARVHQLHQRCQEACRGPEVNPVRRDAFSVAVEVDLVRVAGGEPLLEITQRRRCRPGRHLRLHHQDRPPALDHHEIDLASVHVAKVPEFQLPSLGVELEVNPLEQVRRDQVLEPGSFFGDDAPVVVIVLLLLFDGAQPRRAEGRQAVDGVEPLEDR